MTEVIPPTSGFYDGGWIGGFMMAWLLCSLKYYFPPRPIHLNEKSTFFPNNIHLRWTMQLFWVLVIDNLLHHYQHKHSRKKKHFSKQDFSQDCGCITCFNQLLLTSKRSLIHWRSCLIGILVQGLHLSQPHWFVTRAFYPPQQCLFNHISWRRVSVEYYK